MTRKEIIKGNKISEIHSFVLGGYEQKVLVEGKTDDLPVIITLHGGPGTPVPFSVGCRGMFPEFTDRFIMVYWDQLGCGINNREIDDSFSVSSFVQMTKDLIDKVTDLFPDNKKYIFATSWGSILSAGLLEQFPHIVDGVVVSGQIVKNVFFNDEVMEELRRSPIPKKKMARIEKVTPDNYTSDDMQLISGSLQKYTDGYNNKRGGKPPLGKIIMGLMTSPDYKFSDFKAVMINGYQKNTSLWKEILKTDLTPILGKVEVPYIILQGETDIVASTRTVEELVSSSNNPNLECVVVKNTGHFPGTEMMEELLSRLVSLG